MARFHRILVAVDFGEASQEALEVAIDLSIANDADLTLIHAWEIPAYAYAGMAYLPTDLWSSIELAGKDQLASTLALVRKRVPSAQSVFASGEPARQVLDVADRVNADLIVMGTHGRRGVSRALLGSVAERVVRMSPVPVLSVRARGPAAASLSPETPAAGQHP
jgi:nucleotide-binding universal stress UspA family protein